MILGKVVAVLHLCLWLGGGGGGGATAAAADPDSPDTAACWGDRYGAKTGNWSCTDSEPYLLVSLGDAVVRMKLDGKDKETLLSGVGNSVLMDVNLREKRVYWLDTHTGVLNAAGLDQMQRQKILSLGKGISGLAVDWIQNCVYWSNRRRGTILKADSGGKNLKIILRDLSQPGSVVIDANVSFLFWLSAGESPSIERSDTLGGSRTMVLKVPDRLLALTLDPVEQRLFWVQQGVGKVKVLGSCDYNGNLINVVNLSFRVGRSKPLRMSVFLDHVYMTDSTSRTITRFNKNTGGTPERFLDQNMLQVPTDVRIVHPITQPVPETGHTTNHGCDPQTEQCVSVCSSTSDSGQCKCRSGFTLNEQGDFCQDINECALWNHGCSLGCENVPGSYFCTCPKGYLLLPDSKTCHEIEPCVENSTLCDFACTHTLEGDVCVCPVGSTLRPDGHSCTGCLSVDGGGCSQVCVTLSPGRWECKCQPGYQLQPDGKQCKATGPSAFLLFANMVDIRMVSMNGSEVRKVLEDPGGSLIAVDYDPVHNEVYFADTVSKEIGRVSVDGGSRDVLLSTSLTSPEGLAVDWVNRKLYWTDRGLSTISRSALSGREREILIYEDVLKPRGIAVHPQAQKLFWSDVGSRPALERSDLDGRDREILISSGLVSPSGLTLDYNSQRLYWCDIGTGKIESSRLDGTDRHTLRQNQVARPFAVAVFKDSLWVSNWDDHHIYLMSKRTGHGSERLRIETVQPSALVVMHPLVKPGVNLCLHRNGGCSHLCESRFGVIHCTCHSHHVLSGDGKTCFPTEISSAESSDGGWSDKLKNKSLNDESTPLSLPEAGESATFTEKMVSDQDECFSLSCDVNAQCLLDDGAAVCKCLSGFTGDGHSCVDINECTAGLVECSSPFLECVNTAGGYDCRCRRGFSGDGRNCVAKTTSAPSGVITGNAADDTSPWQRGNTVESCPSSHDSYCMHDGVCFYFPEMESYACNCRPGYMGERCQFSDLEWWELQQAEEEKRRNVVIAVCMVLLNFLLTITAGLTCYYRYGACSVKRSTVDGMSEASVIEDSSTVLPPSSLQYCVVLEHGVNCEEKLPHTVELQRREVCSSFSSKTGENVVCERNAGMLRDLPKSHYDFSISSPTSQELTSDMTSPHNAQPSTASLL